MDNVVNSIGRNFERLLRWAYPGGLFLVLLRMSKPVAFSGMANLPNVKEPWGLVIGGLVAGFTVYLFQAYVINHFISLLFQLANWDINVGLQVRVAECRPPRLGLGRCARLFDRHAEATWRRWGDDLPKGLANYLNYAWASYHAVFTTGWLTLLFFFAKEQPSIFADAAAWHILLPAGLFLWAGLWTYAHLSRVPLNGPQ